MSDKENIIMSASLFSGLPCQICLNPVYLKYSKLTWTCIVKFLVDFLGHQLKELGKSIKSSKTNSRHCIWRLTWRNMNTHCIGQSLLLNAGVWLGPVTLAVGALLLLQVGGSWTWEGPVLLLHVYRIRRNRRMALCIAGIVGRQEVDWHCVGFSGEIDTQCVLLPAALVCGLYLDASTGGPMGIRWVSFTLLVSPLRHIQHTRAGRSVKWRKSIHCSLACGDTQGYHKDRVVSLWFDFCGVSLLCNFEETFQAFDWDVIFQVWYLTKYNLFNADTPISSTTRPCQVHHFLDFKNKWLVPTAMLFHQSSFELKSKFMFIQWSFV